MEALNVEHAGKKERERKLLMIIIEFENLSERGSVCDFVFGNFFVYFLLLFHFVSLNSP